MARDTRPHKNISLPEKKLIMSSDEILNGSPFSLTTVESMVVSDLPEPLVLSHISSSLEASTVQINITY